MSWFSFSFCYAVRPEFVIAMQRFLCCTRRTDQSLSYACLAVQRGQIGTDRELQSLWGDIKPIIVTHFLPTKKKSRVQPENPYCILNVHRLQLEILVFYSSLAAGTSNAVSPIDEFALILHDSVCILLFRYSIYAFKS